MFARFSAIEIYVNTREARVKAFRAGKKGVGLVAGGMLEFVRPGTQYLETRGRPTDGRKRLQEVSGYGAARLSMVEYPVVERPAHRPTGCSLSPPVCVVGCLRGDALSST